MTASEIRHKLARGTAWIGLASSLVALLDFAALIILMKFFVSPEHYGIATMAAAFFPVLDLATDMGLSSAVIQMDGHTKDRVSTVFWINTAMSFLLFGLLVLVAPTIARVYRQPLVADLLEVYGLKLIFQNVYFIPYALMKREFRFKELSVLRIIANVAEFAGKIVFAALGFHVWCFVLGPLARVFVTGVGTQILHPWRPRLVLKLREAAGYLKFGMKTSASQILYYGYTNVDYLAVGYFFGDKALGVYKIAYELILEPVKFISDVVVQIAFPAFARLRHRRGELIEQFITFTRQNLAVVIPFVVVILLAAEDLLYVIRPDLTPAATAARVLCTVGVFRALSHIVPPLLDGYGRPGLTLIYTVVAAVVLPICFFAFAWWLNDWGYLSVATAWAAGYPIAFVVLMILAVGIVGLPLAYYLKRILGIPGCALVGFAAGFGLKALVGDALTPGWRLVVVGGASVVVTLTLLAYLQGMSPAAIARAIKAKPPIPPPDDTGSGTVSGN